MVPDDDVYRVLAFSFEVLRNFSKIYDICFKLAVVSDQILDIEITSYPS